MEFQGSDVKNYKIGILLNHSEAEKYIKLLNLLFYNIFHRNGPTFVHRLAARPLMANTHVMAIEIDPRHVPFLPRQSLT